MFLFLDIIVTPPQESKKQLPIEETEKWDANNINSRKIDKLIGEMMVLQNLPFNFVEGLGFRRLIQELAPQYHLRGRNFFNDFVCNELYGKVAQKVKDSIAKFDHISFTSDIRTDPSTKASMLSLTCHGIAENFNRSSFLLKCETVNGIHQDIIPEKFNTMLSEWNINKEKVHCVIQNGSRKRPAQLAVNYIECAVYKMQLAIRSCLESQENIKIVRQKCKKISTHFNQSIIAQKRLQEIQDRLKQPHLKMTTSSSTRWISTFYMFKRFFNLKDALSLYFNDSDIKPLLPEEWKLIESCIQLLSPFEEATRELSSSHALISSAIPIIQLLENKVDNCLRSPDFYQIRPAVTTLKKELSTMFSHLVENNLYVIATYLDPRYKHKLLTPVTEKKINEDILMIGRMGNSENVSNVHGSESKAKRMRMADISERLQGTSGLGNPCLKNDLAMMLDSSSEDENQETSDNATAEGGLKKELLTYRIKRRINVDESPLKWWSLHRDEFKLLSPIARRFLSTPASVASEQLFSSAGSIYEPLHSRIDPEKAILKFIDFNAPMCNFTY